ncbi:MAG: GFA family protein [Rhizobium sp.]|nr:GFA family protein [Rhizobium sp.]
MEDLDRYMFVWEMLLWAPGEPEASLICHSRDCQRASGAAGLPVLVMRRNGFSAHGPIRSFTSPGGNGSPTARNFCSDCGSLLFGLPEHAPDIVTIYAGTLDEPSRFKTTLLTRRYHHTCFVKDGHIFPLTLSIGARESDMSMHKPPQPFRPESTVSRLE